MKVVVISLRVICLFFSCFFFFFFFCIVCQLLAGAADIIIVQSALVISKSRGLSEILRDILTSTYQICKIEEKIN